MQKRTQIYTRTLPLIGIAVAALCAVNVNAQQTLSNEPARGGVFERKTVPAKP